MCINYTAYIKMKLKTRRLRTILLFEKNPRVLLHKSFVAIFPFGAPVHYTDFLRLTVNVECAPSAIHFAGSLYVCTLKHQGPPPQYTYHVAKAQLLKAVYFLVVFYTSPTYHATNLLQKCLMQMNMKPFISADPLSYPHPHLAQDNNQYNLQENRNYTFIPSSTD